MHGYRSKVQTFERMHVHLWLAAPEAAAAHTGQLLLDLERIELGGPEKGGVAPQAVDSAGV